MHIGHHLCTYPCLVNLHAAVHKEPTFLSLARAVTCNVSVQVVCPSTTNPLGIVELGVSDSNEDTEVLEE
eukprot:4517687-Amphidinium_carterae.1